MSIVMSVEVDQEIEIHADFQRSKSLKFTQNNCQPLKTKFTLAKDDECDMKG